MVRHRVGRHPGPNDSFWSEDVGDYSVNGRSVVLRFLCIAALCSLNAPTMLTAVAMGSWGRVTHVILTMRRHVHEPPRLSQYAGTDRASAPVSREHAGRLRAKLRKAQHEAYPGLVGLYRKTLRSYVLQGQEALEARLGKTLVEQLDEQIGHLRQQIETLEQARAILVGNTAAPSSRVTNGGAPRRTPPDYVRRHTTSGRLPPAESIRRLVSEQPGIALQDIVDRLQNAVRTHNRQPRRAVRNTVWWLVKRGELRREGFRLFPTPTRSNTM